MKQPSLFVIQGAVTMFTLQHKHSALLNRKNGLVSLHVANRCYCLLQRVLTGTTENNAVQGTEGINEDDSQPGILELLTYINICVTGI